MYIHCIFGPYDNTCKLNELYALFEL